MNKEMIELMIQERLSLYFKKNGGPGKERMKRKNTVGVPSHGNTRKTDTTVPNPEFEF